MISNGFSLYGMDMIRKAAFLLQLAACCIAGPALADPEENFAAGMKAYQEGDLIKSMSELQKAADAGHAGAQAAFGYLLDKSDYDGDAVAYYRKSADQGNEEGMFGLGSLFAAGEGIEKDYAQARIWFVKAAEKGQPQAVRVLAEAYAFGGLGLTDEERKGSDGARWFVASANEGYLPIMEHLAGLYVTGGQGISPDAEAAAKLKVRIADMRGTNNSNDGGKKKRRRFFD